MSANLVTYPFRCVTDARSAMADRLCEYVQGLEFTLPKSSSRFQFKEVLATWADFSQRVMGDEPSLPAAAVLPDRPIYEDSGLAPRAIESTWSGGDPTECDASGRKLYPIGDGSGDGYCLFTHSEMVVPFVLVFRARTKPQRRAIMRRMEQVFVEDGSLLDPSFINPAFDLTELDEPIRYGRLLEVPRYFNRKARFTLEAQQLLDTESSAGENRWLGQVELSGRMQVCVLRRVRAMKPRVHVVVDGITENRAASS